MISADVQKLNAGNIVELFVFDPRTLGGTITYFHPGTNGLSGNVVWQGVNYQPFPIEASGFEFSGKGTLPKPTIRVANVTGLISALCNELDDLIGAKITRKRTFLKYLDAVNFPGAVNTSADPTVQFADDIYFVNRKASENNVYVEFELAAAMDLEGVQLPRRQIIANVCAWQYRDANCGYAGGPVADINDIPTTDLSNDKCGKRLTSCKLRFGENSVLNYGAFPSAGQIH